jgi:hypothetical protein
VERVSPVDTSGSSVSNKIITINFNTNHSSFYFAIQDEATCIVTTRLIVFYTVCPAQTNNLIYYPETIIPPPSHNYENLSISATCIENAEPENELAPVVTCSADGVWVDSAPWPGMGCQCIRGYFRERVNDSETCKRKALIRVESDEQISVDNLTVWSKLAEQLISYIHGELWYISIVIIIID